MKEPINLLPAVAKRNRMRILYVQRVQVLLNWCVALLAVLLVLIGIVYGGLLWVQKYGRSTMPTPTGTAGDAEKEITDTNAFLNAFHTQVQASTAWTDKIRDVLQILPDQLQLATLAVVADSTKAPTIITATGVAEDATQVVAWRKKIEQLPWVASVEAPLDNFATNQHGSFTVTIHLVPPKPAL